MGFARKRTQRSAQFVPVPRQKQVWEDTPGQTERSKISPFFRLFSFRVRCARQTKFQSLSHLFDVELFVCDVPKLLSEFSCLTRIVFHFAHFGQVSFGEVSHSAAQHNHQLFPERRRAPGDFSVKHLVVFVSQDQVDWHPELELEGQTSVFTADATQVRLQSALVSVAPVLAWWCPVWLIHCSCDDFWQSVRLLKRQGSRSVMIKFQV